MAAVLVIVLKFSNSPVKRARRRGYLRNVTVALGNSRDPSAIPALAQSLLNDPEPLVRAHAAWALGKIRDENAKQALDQAVRCDNNISVLAEIRSALSEST
jgi:epoxyqueuosine reductase